MEIKKGHVGFAKSHAREVPAAIKKAMSKAQKNLITVPMVNTTIPHAIIGHHNASRVLIKPAKAGVGVISGGATRVVMELAGVQDVVTKSLGSNNRSNVLRAVFDGISKLRLKEYFENIKKPLDLPESSKPAEETKTTSEASEASEKPEAEHHEEPKQTASESEVVEPVVAAQADNKTEEQSA